jgi:hypothetical protein
MRGKAIFPRCKAARSRDLFDSFFNVAHHEQ